MSGKITVVEMTDAGVASVLGGGKVRWVPFQGGDANIKETAATVMGAGHGTIVTQMAISKDSEWLAIARYVSGSNAGAAGSSNVYLMKLKGGDGAEVLVPSNETGVTLSGVSALHIAGKKNSRVVYIGDKTGNFLSAPITSTGMKSSTNAAAQLVQKDLGPISAITSHEGGIYVATQDGVNIIKIDPSNGLTLDKFPLIPTPPVRRLLVIPPLNVLMVASRHRHIQLHALDHTGEPQALAADAIPSHVDFNTFRQGAPHMLTVSENGVVSIWKWTKPGKAPHQPSGVIKLDASSAKGHAILNARFTGGTTITVVYGTYIKPQFQRVSYIKKNDEIVKEFLITSSDKGLLIDSTEDTPKGDKKKKSGVTTNVGGATDAILPQTVKSDMNKLSGDVDRLSFADRLNQVSSPAEAKSTKSKRQTAVPQGGSSIALLTAALNSGDREQLWTVINQNDQRVIATTVASLPVGQVVPLLTILLQHFAKKPMTHVVRWLRIILITHQSYLASLPQLLDNLAGLYNSLEDRLKRFPDLVKLHGRFDLLVSQIEVARSGSTPATALQTYMEDDDDEDEDEGWMVSSSEESDDEEDEEMDSDDDVEGEDGDEEEDGEDGMDVDEDGEGNNVGSDEDGDDDDADDE